MEETNWSKDNKKRMIVALAILLGADLENSAESYSKIPEDIKKQALKIYDEKNLSLTVEQEARIPEQQIQIQMAETGQSAQIELYKIVGSHDSRTCPDCAEWQGRTVTMHPDGKHDTVQDFINNHGFHINCRCSLQPLSVEEIPLNELNPRHDIRKAINPAVYNSSLNNARLVLN